MAASEGPLPTLIKKYQEFCQIFFKNNLTCFTRITCNSFPQIDHILKHFTEKIIQSSVTGYSMSDRQLIFCTRKKEKGLI